MILSMPLDRLICLLFPAALAWFLDEVVVVKPLCCRFSFNAYFFNDSFLLSLLPTKFTSFICCSFLLDFQSLHQAQFMFRDMEQMEMQTLLLRVCHQKGWALSFNFLRGVDNFLHFVNFINPGWEPSKFSVLQIELELFSTSC